MRHRLLISLGIAVSLAVVADTATWFWVTDRMQAEAAAWLADRRAEGWTAAAGPVRRGGWPFEAEVAFPAVSMTMSGATPRATPGAAFSWQAPLVRLRIAPLAPATLGVALEGVQHVQAGAWPPIDVAAALLTAAVPVTDAAEPVLVQMSSVHAEAAGATVGIARLTAKLLPGAIDFEADGIDLPAGIPWPFGAGVTSVAGTAALDGAVPAAADLPRRAALWRDGGGKLRIIHAAVHWGALAADGSGAVTLDAALQPRADSVVHVVDYPAAIAVLAQSGAIRPNDARVAGTLLGLLAQTPAGGKPEVTVPVALRDGLVSVGSFPIVRVPLIDWGQ